MPCCNTATYKRLQRPLFRTCSYTAHAIKQCTRLYRRFSGYLPYSTAANNRPTQAAITLPAPRWSVSQRRSTSSEYQIPAPRRTLYRSAQPPYYNKVYKGATVRPCYRSMPDGVADCKPRQPGGVSMLPTPGGLQSGTGSAVRAHRLAHSTRRSIPAAGARRAARNHWRLPPQLFSGFRPIANRGQQ